jgi:hypothetical protein
LARRNTPALVCRRSARSFGQLLDRVRAAVQVVVLDAADVAEADADPFSQVSLAEVLGPPQYPHSFAEGLQGLLALAIEVGSAYSVAK